MPGVYPKEIENTESILTTLTDWTLRPYLWNKSDSTRFTSVRNFHMELFHSHQPNIFQESSWYHIKYFFFFITVNKVFFIIRKNNKVFLIASNPLCQISTIATISVLWCEKQNIICRIPLAHCYNTINKTYFTGYSVHCTTCILFIQRNFDTC